MSRKKHQKGTIVSINRQGLYKQPHAYRQIICEFGDKGVILHSYNDKSHLYYEVFNLSNGCVVICQSNTIYYLSKRSGKWHDHKRRAVIIK